MKNPYQIIIRRHVTEKAQVLGSLHTAKDVKSSKPSLKACDKPKIVFVVDIKATKPQIKYAVEHIFENKVKVLSVNTIVTHHKWKRMRGHVGRTSQMKKAIVTFRAGDVVQG